MRAEARRLSYWSVDFDIVGIAGRASGLRVTAFIDGGHEDETNSAKISER